MRGGSLKISLNRCWFCIRCHFLISILFRLDKEGEYCVTKGRSFSGADLFLCCRQFSCRQILPQRGILKIAAG